VLLENRPLVIREIEPLADAVIWGGHPGMFGADAIVDIISGEVNPSGRLPFTYPRFTGSLVPYDHKHSERLDIRGGQEAFNPQYAFGYGLGYTSFEYEGLEITPRDIRPGDAVSVSVSVTNTGNRSGKEVVQLYLTDIYASITPYVKRLRGFEKVDLEAGERKTVRFILAADDMAFIGPENRPVVESGEFMVQIGPLESSFVIR
jgi:beta-glucosidase